MKLIVFCLLWLLVACGGGASGQSASTLPTARQDPTGIWAGTVHSDISNSDTQSTWVIQDSGNLYSIDSYLNTVVGVVVVSANTGIGSGVWIDSFGNNSTSYSIIIENVVNKSTLTGTYIKGSDRGRFNLSFDQNSLKPVDLNLIQGNYSIKKIGSLNKSSVSLLPNGQFINNYSSWSSSELLVRNGNISPSPGYPGVSSVDCVLALSSAETGIQGNGIAVYSDQFKSFSFIITYGTNKTRWIGNMEK